jgi:hypothetical protein
LAPPGGKHGFSFGAANSMSLAALSLLAANLPEITDEPTPSIYPVATLAPDLAIPPSFAGIGGIDPLPLLTAPVLWLVMPMALLLMKLVASLKYQVMETTYRESTTWFFCLMIHCLIFFEQMTMKLFKMDSIPPWSATVGTSIRLSTLPPGGKILKKRRCGMVLCLPFMLFSTAGLIAVKEADTTWRRW